MDIGIYANPDYYFQYDSEKFQTAYETYVAETDPAKQVLALKALQVIISSEYVNGYLFQLAKTGVANANIRGLWENAPTQAVDLTAVYWVD